MLPGFFYAKIWTKNQNVSIIYMLSIKRKRIFSKTIERLRRKARGPVKWQPVAVFIRALFWENHALFYCLSM